MSDICTDPGSAGKPHARLATNGGGDARDSTPRVEPLKRGSCASCAAACSFHIPSTATTTPAAVAAEAEVAAGVGSMRIDVAVDTATRGRSRQETFAAPAGNCYGGWNWASRSMREFGGAMWASLYCLRRPSRGALGE